MDALRLNNNNNNNNNNTQSAHTNANHTENTDNNTGSAASPRHYDPDYFASAMNTHPSGGNPNNSNTSNNHNTMSGNYNNSALVNSNKPREDSLGQRQGRQDSISFYTNLGNNGGRFSTDSNSSISNFLNFTGAGDQPPYDSNGRGMSIINNLFLPPAANTAGSYQSTAPSSSNSTAQTGVGPQGTAGTSFSAGNDFSNFGQFRRPSEQLEPFNPAVKLKIPSFSKKGSVAYPTGTSFSETADFDFFGKRDSVRTRQPSFLNPNFNENYFDFFAKRDSLKNLTEEDLLKEVVIPKAPGTRSEPDTNMPNTTESVPERPQTAMGNDNSQFMQYLQHQQQQGLPPPQDPQTQQQHQQQQQQLYRPLANAYDYTEPYIPRQRGVPVPQPMPQMSQPLPAPQPQLQQIQPAIKVEVDTKPKKRSRAKRQRVQATQPTESVPDGPHRRNAIQPTYVKQSLSPNMNQHQAVSPTSSQYSNSSDKKLISNQEPALADDGRPLLGATKVDQLMLVIQARKKGIHNQIPQASDGSIMENGDGVLPQKIDLVGGIEKPKQKSNKSFECNYCHKSFTQSTHLDVHVRSHIGYKPFVCEYCGKRFTQGGNLKTHERLHTGEKPYKCETCGRDFSRKGNLAAHMLTHENLKPFECKLDNCGKAFTQLGNLKAHQNRFHLKTLNELTRRLAEIVPNDTTMGGDEKELLEYFASLYKNSNRGIKGRGKKHGADGSVGSSSTSPVQHHAEPVLPQDSQDQGFDGFKNNGAISFGMGDDGNKSIAFKNVNYQQ